MLSFVRIRDAIFTTAGYNLNVREAAPDGRLKGSNAFFVTTDSNGKATSTSRVAGCESDADGDVFIHLKPYRGDPAKAPAAVELMCARLAAAVDGWERERREFGELALWLVVNELKYAPDSRTQLGLLSALYGTARVHDELNKRGTTKGLFDVDVGKMVAEAFGK